MINFIVLSAGTNMSNKIQKLPILFENDFCMVLNKPSGLSVQGGEGVSVSLDSILSQNYSPRPLLVHRLDRDTSGVILVAKSKNAAAGFSALFAGVKSQNHKSVIKKYLGICAGNPGDGVIRLDLNIRGKEREAETYYKNLSSETVGGISCSLLELELGTGRMHQIRRHLAGIGHPLLGDDKYGDFSLNKTLRKSCGLKHLLLHASRLVIPSSPGLVPDGLDISAPLPDYFPIKL